MNPLAPRPPSPIPHENDIQFMFFLAKLAGDKGVLEDSGYRATAYRYKGIIYLASMEKLT